MVLVSTSSNAAASCAEVHQLLCGRDIAVAETANADGHDGSDLRRRQIFGFASQMANYVYVIIDKETRAACLIDPCWDVTGIVNICKETLGVSEISCAVFTHRHFDHTGGRVPASLVGVKGVRVEGVAEVRRAGVKRVCVGDLDAEAVCKQTGLHSGALHRLRDGERIAVGGSTFLETIHTPGHTPGSICLMLLKGAGKDPRSTIRNSGVLFTGDTLFIGSCGRYDLPESNPRALLASLNRLSSLDEGCIVLPGHNYARPAHTTIGQEKKTNAMLLQAMRLTQQESTPPGTLLRKNDVVAFVSLPKYIECAREAFLHSSLKGGDDKKGCCSKL